MNNSGRWRWDIAFFRKEISNLLKTNGENDLMKMLIIYCFIIFCSVSGTISFFFGMSEWQCLLDMKKWVLWLSFRSFDSLFSGQIDNSIHHLVEFIKHEPQTFMPRKVPSGWVGGLTTKYHAGYLAWCFFCETFPPPPDFSVAGADDGCARKGLWWASEWCRDSKCHVAVCLKNLGFFQWWDTTPWKFKGKD